MAQSRKISRNKIMKIQAYSILLLLVLIGIGIGFFIGKVSTPIKTETVTVTETIEVPRYEQSKLPEVVEHTYYDVPLSYSLQNYIFEICADKEVPVSLVMAMIEHESGFNTEIVSSADDYGLMQINSINHEWLEEDYRCADMTNPYQNVFCGVTIISQYLEKYEGDYHKALMAYNMGDYGARKAWENDITSTSYSTTIVELMNEYEQEVKDNATGN